MLALCHPPRKLASGLSLHTSERRLIEEAHALLARLPARHAMPSQLYVVTWSSCHLPQGFFFFFNLTIFWYDFCNVFSSATFLTEMSTIVREHLEQLTEGVESDGSITCQVLIFPYCVNGAARGYRLEEPQQAWAKGNQFIYTNLDVTNECSTCKLQMYGSRYHNHLVKYIFCKIQDSYLLTASPAGSRLAWMGIALPPRWERHAICAVCARCGLHGQSLHGGGWLSCSTWPATKLGCACRAPAVPAVGNPQWRHCGWLFFHDCLWRQNRQPPQCRRALLLGGWQVPQMGRLQSHVQTWNGL